MAEYENKNFNEIQEIDDRVVRFMRILNEAPEDIQFNTAEFLSTLDELKQNFIASMVQTKKAEKRYEEASRHVYLTQKAYDSFLEKYLVQIGPDCTEAEDALEKSKVEMNIAVKSLDTAERTLRLSKEELYRISKKSEHAFLCFLKHYRDKKWLEYYSQTSQEDINDPIYEQLHKKIVSAERKYKTYAEQNIYDVLCRKNFSDIISDVSSENTEPKELLSVTYNEKTGRVDKQNVHNESVCCAMKNKNDLIYEEIPSKHKQKKKQSGLMKFLQSKIHGPWEGWDDI